MGAWTGKCSNTILEILRVQASLHNEGVPAFSLERPIFFSRADTFFPCLPYPAIVAPLGRPARRRADPPAGAAPWRDPAAPRRRDAGGGARQGRRTVPRRLRLRLGVPSRDDGARPAGAHGRAGPFPHAVHARRPEAAHGPRAGTRDEPRPRPERGPGAVVRRCGPPPRRPPRATPTPRARREHDLRPRAAVGGPVRALPPHARAFEGIRVREAPPRDLPGGGPKARREPEGLPLRRGPPPRGRVGCAAGGDAGGPPP